MTLLLPSTALPSSSIEWVGGRTYGFRFLRISFSAFCLPTPSHDTARKGERKVESRARSRSFALFFSISPPTTASVQLNRARRASTREKKIGRATEEEEEEKNNNRQASTTIKRTLLLMMKGKLVLGGGLSFLLYSVSVGGDGKHVASGRKTDVEWV